MFEYPGDKIKAVSIIMFWLVSIASVILAFTLGINEIGSVKVFFGFLIGGPTVAYISSLILIGFGDLVENSSEALMLMKQLKNEESKVAGAVIENSEDTISSTHNDSQEVTD